MLHNNPKLLKFAISTIYIFWQMTWNVLTTSAHPISEETSTIYTHTIRICLPNRQTG